jgi:saccharopine dehydrogenase (NAD+, L-lysine-forming)
MARILILGGYGFTGRLLARHLLEQTRAEIVLAGRRLEVAQKYADQLNAEFKSSRVSAIYADAASGQSLQAALHAVSGALTSTPRISIGFRQK